MGLGCTLKSLKPLPKNDGKKSSLFIGSWTLQDLTAAYYLGLEGIAVDIFEEPSQF